MWTWCWITWRQCWTLRTGRSKDLMLQMVVLLTRLTGQRGQTLHSIKVSDVRMFPQKCVINFSEKQKHTRPGYHTEPATILAFSANDRLCFSEALGMIDCA